MNYAKKVTKKISNRANKFEQSEEDKNIFEDEINELQKLAAANMARAEVAASMAHADLAARRAVKLGMETMQEDAVHELVKNRKSNKDESEEQSESSEDSGDHKLPPVHIVVRPEVAKKSAIEEDDGDDDDWRKMNSNLEMMPHQMQPSLLLYLKWMRPLLLMTSMKKVCHRIL
jgi:hypothetical protein